MSPRTSKIRVRDKKSDKPTPAWYVGKRVLKLHDITYAELAEKMNVSVTSIHGMVTYPPNVMHIKMMAETIGCSFFDFFDFSAESRPDSRPVCGDAIASSPTITCPTCGQQFLLTPVASSSEEISTEEISTEEISTEE